MSVILKKEPQVSTTEIVSFLQDISPESNIKPETKLLDILKTPLELLEFVLQIEIAYSTDFKIKEFLDSQTVAGLIDLIKSRVGDNVL
jgi:acyl carrier protein